MTDTVVALTGATLSHVRCPACSYAVPVECGDVTGLTLDGMIDDAVRLAGSAHPDHGPVRVGA